jgi:hypothetical protein
MGYRTRLAGLVLALVSAAALTVACGSSNNSASSAASPAASEDYASCLRKNGVTMPQGNGSGRPSGMMPSGGRPGRVGGSGGPRGSGDPSGGPGGRIPQGVDPSAWAKAQEACAALRPSGGFGNGNRGNANAAYRNCLSEHGVTSSAGAQLNSTDPTVAEAMKTCAPLRETGSAPAPSAT